MYPFCYNVSKTNTANIIDHRVFNIYFYFLLKGHSLLLLFLLYNNVNYTVLKNTNTFSQRLVKNYISQ